MEATYKFQATAGRLIYREMVQVLHAMAHDIGVDLELTTHKGLLEHMVLGTARGEAQAVIRFRRMSSKYGELLAS